MALKRQPRQCYVLYLGLYRNNRLPGLIYSFRPPWKCLIPVIMASSVFFSVYWIPYIHSQFKPRRDNCIWNYICQTFVVSQHLLAPLLIPILCKPSVSTACSGLMWVPAPVALLAVIRIIRQKLVGAAVSSFMSPRCLDPGSRSNLLPGLTVGFLMSLSLDLRGN